MKFKNKLNKQMSWQIGSLNMTIIWHSWWNLNECEKCWECLIKWIPNNQNFQVFASSVSSATIHFASVPLAIILWLRPFYKQKRISNYCTSKNIYCQHISCLTLVMVPTPIILMHFGHDQNGKFSHFDFVFSLLDYGPGC